MNSDLPRQVQIKIVKNQGIIADKCHVAVRFADRLRGLIGKRSLTSGEGVFFPRCNSVHMWFMRFSIDVVFVRSERTSDGVQRYVVSSARENTQPWRLLPLADWRATETLELPAGTVRKHQLHVGDELCIG